MYAPHFDLPRALPPGRISRSPLRILAIVPYAGIPPELREEERAVRMALWDELEWHGLAKMTEISPATRRGLVKAVQSGQSPDIVHFYDIWRRGWQRGAAVR